MNLPLWFFITYSRSSLRYLNLSIEFAFSRITWAYHYWGLSLQQFRHVGRFFMSYLELHALNLLIRILNLLFVSEVLTTNTYDFDSSLASGVFIIMNWPHHSKAKFYRRQSWFNSSFISKAFTIDNYDLNSSFMSKVFTTDNYDLNSSLVNRVFTIW